VEYSLYLKLAKYMISYLPGNGRFPPKSGRDLCPTSMRVLHNRGVPPPLSQGLLFRVIRGEISPFRLVRMSQKDMQATKVPEPAKETPEVPLKKIKTPTFRAMLSLFVFVCVCVCVCDGVMAG